MSSRFQSAVLGSSPVYPDAIVWSEENLVAAACDNTVLILNPGNLNVRGVVTIPTSKPFPLGVIDGGEEDLLNECLLPCHLSWNTRPSVRSIAWSPVGLANNAGCLLAVCTTAGRVKLYRFPFREFSVEWIEVGDISEMLYDYLTSSNFGECQIMSLESLDREAEADHECATELPVSNLRKKRKRNNGTAAKYSESLDDNNVMQIVPASVYKGKPPFDGSEDHNLPLITVQQYASRNAMLMSLTVAWSPIVRRLVNDVTIPCDSSKSCSILAVGGTDGRFSLWRVQAPECYSIYRTTSSSKVSLVGTQKAHNTWITAMDWALCASDDSKSQYLLATGSFDGVVRVWQMNGEELLNISEAINDPFSLLKEAVTADSATVSVLSLTVHSQSPWRLLMAIGKGYGAFEVWILDILTNELQNIGCYNAHDRIVTGLTWTFDGHCLYSCSQDNTMKSWILVGKSLCEVPIPSSTPCLKSAPDVPYVFTSCFGLALSPGNLAIAVARRFDVDQLDPMYEGRSHKAAVEFYWIGGQQLDLSSPTSPKIDCESFPGFPNKESTWWESNVLWALKQYENCSKLLTIWDVVTVLMELKQSAPEYLDHVLRKWLNSYFRAQFGISISRLSEVVKFLSKLPSRQLQLINIISRHLGPKESRVNKMNNKQEEEEWSGSKAKDVNFWMDLLSKSENELLERLIGLKFSAILGALSNSSMFSIQDGCWSADGLPQMEQWVSHSVKTLKDPTKDLAAEVTKVEKRIIHDIVGYQKDEQCNFCSGLVPFESTDHAICCGANNDSECNQRHKLQRCSISMRILPTKPSWHCICCKRWATKLAPIVIFTMPEYPSDLKSYLDSSDYKNLSTPFCLFCGTLLQRLQPEYSLSPAPI
ncbi:uncharacterized protein LOC127259578 isoform X2 [Andrographis paniculata]|nr:uncharacterized protein LOC127259578 isoform X2 [Andrographis paniculata]XP_051142938.1 uncharacterized protein LOC127259578 isoform X2 [Andrographis paniculata]